VDLQYDKNQWHELPVIPKQTLQMFVTNRCNLRCVDCFYADGLGKNEMSLGEYQDLVGMALVSAGVRYLPHKVNLLGGEPALHPNLAEMVKYNSMLGLQSVIYTNGYNLDEICQIPGAKVRVGVHGVRNCDKPLLGIPKTDHEFTLVYMTNKLNFEDIYDVPLWLKYNYPQVIEMCISSIQNAHTRETLHGGTSVLFSPIDYANHINSLLVSRILWGNIRHLFIPTRGIFTPSNSVSSCRFINVFTGGKREVMCPLDISTMATKLQYPCNKETSTGACMLQKIMLQRNDAGG
jgi:organic radical activating enzyme